VKYELHPIGNGVGVGLGVGEAVGDKVNEGVMVAVGAGVKVGVKVASVPVGAGVTDEEGVGEGVGLGDKVGLGLGPINPLSSPPVKLRPQAIAIQNLLEAIFCTGTLVSTTLSCAN